MMRDSVELKGLDALLKNIAAVKSETSRKGGRFALRKAAQVIRDAARQGAMKVDDPATNQVIAKNIVERWNAKLFKTTGNLGFRVGVLGGAKQYANTKDNVRKGRAGKEYLTDGDKTNPGGDTWYWRLIEFGTSKMRAQPFFRKAGEQSAQAATDVFIKEYGKALDRAIKKASK